MMCLFTHLPQDDWRDECQRELLMPFSALFRSSDSNQAFVLHPSLAPTWAELRQQLAEYAKLHTNTSTAAPVPTVFVLATNTTDTGNVELDVDDPITITVPDVALVPGLDWLEADPANSSLVRVKADAGSRAVISCAGKDRAFVIRYPTAALPHVCHR
jgi:hypothetical protein